MFPHDQYNAAMIRYQQYLQEAHETRLQRLATSDRITLGMRVFTWMGERLISFGENLKRRAERRTVPVNMQALSSVQRMQF
ncbi:MAG: hypothetical protein M1434_13115 [Chloroflexi bacterium]|nr:hypothetical protein [Chloroflexota bacterium]MCL5275662.1 hypothetical protein [Chloroflexota bacterium]